MPKDRLESRYEEDASFFDLHCRHRLARPGPRGRCADHQPRRESRGQATPRSRQAHAHRFYADWCGPCRALAPTLDRLAEEHADRLALRKIDITKGGSPAGAQYGVSAIPYLLLFDESGTLISEGGAGPVLQELERRLGIAGGGSFARRPIKGPQGEFPGRTDSAACSRRLRGCALPPEKPRDCCCKPSDLGGRRRALWVCCTGRGRLVRDDPEQPRRAVYARPARADARSSGSGRRRPGSPPR